MNKTNKNNLRSLFKGVNISDFDYRTRNVKSLLTSAHPVGNRILQNATMTVANLLKRVDLAIFLKEWNANLRLKQAKRRAFARALHIAEARVDNRS